MANDVKLLSNLQALLNKNEDEYSDLPEIVTPNAAPGMSAIREAMKAQRDEETKKATKEAATEIMAMIKSSQDVIESHRTSIAHKRRLIEAEKKTIERLAVARVYGEETMNFLPLAVELGMLRVPTADFIANPQYSVPLIDADRILKQIKQVRAQKKSAKASKA